MKPNLIIGIVCILVGCFNILFTGIGWCELACVIVGILNIIEYKR